jgi:hypothetical protein
VNFAESEKAVPVTAVFDEGRLKGGFYAGDLGEVDVTPQLTPRSGFKVEFFDLLAAHHHDPGLFRVGGIDEHFVRHDGLSAWRSAARPAAGAAPEAGGPAVRTDGGGMMRSDCVRSPARHSARALV